MSISDLTLVSLLNAFILLALSGRWFFYSFKTSSDSYCSVILLPLLVLTVLSIIRKNPDGKLASIPIKINLSTLVLVISIAAIRSYWDIDFMLHSKEYLSAAQIVDVSEMDFSKGDGIGINLPQQFEHLSAYNEIYVTQDNSHETMLLVFPKEHGDLDNLLNAFVYVSSENKAGLPEKCVSGRSVNPYFENWYYCVVSLNQIK